jgi:hypothetical protein
MVELICRGFADSDCVGWCVGVSDIHDYRGQGGNPEGHLRTGQGENNMSTFWMNAKRESDCAECTITILEGDRMVYDTETFKAFCEECGEEVIGKDPWS